MSGQGSTRHRIVQTESFRCIYNERNELSVSSSSMINSYLMALSSKVVRQTKAIWFSRVVVVVVRWCARQSHYRPAQTTVAGNCIDWKGKKRLRYKCRESFERNHSQNWSSNLKPFPKLINVGKKKKCLTKVNSRLVQMIPVPSFPWRHRTIVGCSFVFENSFHY